MRVAMHQSQYLPWAPYFRKIAAVDCFVLMDKVQFQKNGVQNRNRVRNRSEAFWLTIPVSGKLQDHILDKRIADATWTRRHWKSLQACYARAPCWDAHAADLEQLYQRDYPTLGEANETFLRYLLGVLGIDTPMIRLSSLRVEGAKSDLVLNVCRELGADCYVSGQGAVDYLDRDAFARAGMQIEFKPSEPVVYDQGGRTFIPGLSLIDMLMYQGPEVIREYLYPEDS